MYLYVAIAKQGYNYQYLPQDVIFLGVFTTKEAAIEQIENHMMGYQNYSNYLGWCYFVFKTYPDDLMNTHEDRAVYVIYDYIRI
jgi:hypothetical protein